MLLDPARVSVCRDYFRHVLDIPNTGACAITTGTVYLLEAIGALTVVGISMTILARTTLASRAEFLNIDWGVARVARPLPRPSNGVPRPSNGRLGGAIVVGGASVYAGPKAGAGAITTAAVYLFEAIGAVVHLGKSITGLARTTLASRAKFHHIGRKVRLVAARASL